MGHVIGLSVVVVCKVVLGCLVHINVVGGGGVVHTVVG